MRPKLQITAIVFLALTFNGCSQAQARPALAVTGATVIDVAFDVTDRLANFPESGRIVPEMNDPNFREIILGNYRLIYRLRSGDVQIVTVHHGARQLNPAELESGA